MYIFIFIGKLSEFVECGTLDGEIPVVESITSSRSDPSSMDNVEFPYLIGSKPHTSQPSQN